MAEIIAMYKKVSTLHSYVDSQVDKIDTLSYISTRIWFQLRNNIFTTFTDQGYQIFTHLTPKQIIYYVGYGRTDINIQLNTQLITLHSEIWDWYKFLTEENSIKTLTQCIN